MVPLSHGNAPDPALSFMPLLALDACVNIIPEERGRAKMDPNIIGMLATGAGRLRVGVPNLRHTSVSWER